MCCAPQGEEGVVARLLAMPTADERAQALRFEIERLPVSITIVGDAEPAPDADGAVGELAAAAPVPAAAARWRLVAACEATAADLERRRAEGSVGGGAGGGAGGGGLPAPMPDAALCKTAADLAALAKRLVTQAEAEAESALSGGGGGVA